ncbi:MarC family protein [Georgenia sp. Z1491]|uniref:MarC family protein n=1 Tax=Georgenia sp. Z1491 TaxID=3416707 RepID=UPI003CE75B1F
MSDLVDLAVLVSTFVTLFVIMDPVGNLPIFLSLTSTMTIRERSRAALAATCVSLGVIGAFAAGGPYILDFLGITVPALQLAGGLLLLIVAMQLLSGAAEEPGPSGSGAAVALVPMGTPLMAGPGAIVAAMLAVQDADTGPQLTGVVIGIVGLHVVIGLSLRFSSVVHRVLGVSGTTLVTRLSGMLLAAIAVQLVATATFAFVDMYLAGR